MPLLEFLKRKYIIEALVSPKGIGFDGEDISVLNNCEKTGLSFSNQVISSIERSDTIIVTDITEGMNSLRSFAFTGLRCAVDKGKDVYCFLNLDIEEKRELERLRDISGGNLVIISTDGFNKYDDIKARNLFDFNAPVLYICEEVPECDGYAVFLRLAQIIQSKGKRVLAISNDRYNKVLSHVYVNFDVNTTISKQLFRFNFIVHELEYKYHPDIILIKLPYPLMRFNEDNVFDCGVSAYLTSQAVPGEGCIYCTHAMPLPEEFWRTYTDGVLVKYGYPLLAVHVSNRMIDSTGDESLGVIRIPKQEVENRVKDIKNSAHLPFFYLLNDDQIEELGDLIISEFIDIPYGVIQ